MAEDNLCSNIYKTYILMRGTLSDFILLKRSYFEWSAKAH
jgi:hypothetical protein